MLSKSGHKVLLVLSRFGKLILHKQGILIDVLLAYNHITCSQLFWNLEPAFDCITICLHTAHFPMMLY